MPTPRKDEKKDKFIQRCIPIVIKEGTAKDNKQAFAVCQSMWEQNKRKSEMSKILDISIMGVIGEENNSSEAIAQQLKDSKAETIRVNINSPGGSAFDGIAIYNILKNTEKNIETNILGAAFSAASMIAMAGNKVNIAKSAMLMIHNPFMRMTSGDAEKLKKTSQTLDELQKNIAKIYSEKTGINQTEMLQMMKDETWLNASKAKDKGFIDEIIEPKEKSEYNVLRAAAMFDYKNAPNIQIQEPEKKPLIKIGDHKYPLTKKEQEMLQQIKEIVGVDDENKIINSIKELQNGYKPDGGEEIQGLKTKNQELESQVEKLSSTVTELSKFQRTAIEKQRDDEINALIENGTILPAQREAAESLWELGYDKFQAFIEAQKGQFKHLQEPSGSDGEGKKEDKFKSAGEEIAAKAQEMIKEGKANDLAEAQAKVMDEDEELYKRYEQESYQEEEE